MKFDLFNVLLFLISSSNLVLCQIKLSPEINKQSADCLQATCTVDELRKALQDSMEERSYLRDKVKDLTLEVSTMARDALYLIEWKRDQISSLEKEVETCRHNHTKLLEAHKALEHTILSGLQRIENVVDAKLHNHWLNTTQTCREIHESGILYHVTSAASNILHSRQLDMERFASSSHVRHISILAQRYTSTLYSTISSTYNNMMIALQSSSYYRYACGVVNEYILSDSGLQLLARIDYVYRKLNYSAYRLHIKSNEIYRECLAVIVKSVRFMIRQCSKCVRHIVSALLSVPFIQRSVNADMLEKIVYFVGYFMALLVMWLYRATFRWSILVLFHPIVLSLHALAKLPSYFRRKNPPEAIIENGVDENNNRKWHVDNKTEG